MPSYLMLMEYLDALLRHGWTPDPADRVEVVPVHSAGCPARAARACACQPRLTLRPVPLRRDMVREEPFEDVEQAVRAAG